MRALLCHCRNYRSEVKRLATTPVGIQPETIGDKASEATNAIVALITVENGDNPRDVSQKIAQEIRIMCRDTAHSKVVLFPFAHLSSDLAETSLVLAFFDELSKELEDLHPERAHFGSDKKLLLDIFGHKGNIRFREF
jgi:threonyl-tRNA synthetase